MERLPRGAYTTSMTGASLIATFSIAQAGGGNLNSRAGRRGSYQMLTRVRPLAAGETVLVIGASVTVGTAPFDLARHMGPRAIGTCSAVNLEPVRRFDAEAVDYLAGHFVPAERALTLGVGVAMAFDAIGDARFACSFACLAHGGLIVGYGSQTISDNKECVVAAAQGLCRLYVWVALPFFFGGRRSVFYRVTSRRKTYPKEFTHDLLAHFELLRLGAIHPLVVERLPLTAARAVQERIEAGGLDGKNVLLPWGRDRPARWRWFRKQSPLRPCRPFISGMLPCPGTFPIVPCPADLGT